MFQKSNLNHLILFLHGQQALAQAKGRCQTMLTRSLGLATHRLALVLVIFCTPDFPTTTCFLPPLTRAPQLGASSISVGEGLAALGGTKVDSRRVGRVAAARSEAASLYGVHEISMSTKGGLPEGARRALVVGGSGRIGTAAASHLFAAGRFPLEVRARKCNRHQLESCRRASSSPK